MKPPGATRVIDALGRRRRALAPYAALAVVALIAGAATLGLEFAANTAERLYSDTLAVHSATLVFGWIALVCGAWSARRMARQVSGSGVSEMLAATVTTDPARREELVSTRTALLRTAFTLGELLFGASVGRQGPSVSLSAAIVYALRPVRSADFQNFARSAIVVGAAAGVTAAYNAPIAGILFVLEELRVRRWMTGLTVAAGAAGVAALTTFVMGGGPHFGYRAFNLLDPVVWADSIATAVVAGVAGCVFAKAVVALPSLWQRVRDRHSSISTMIGAAVVCSLSPIAAGTGEVPINAMLDGRYNSVAYPMAKVVATLSCFWIGLAGGLFGPAISIGSGIGAGLHLVLGAPPPAPLVLSGMAAFLAAATRTPFTAAAFAVEVSGAYSGSPLLLATALVGSGASRLMSGGGMYSSPAARLLG